MNSNIENERAVIGGLISDGMTGGLADEAFTQLIDIELEDQESRKAFGVLVDLYRDREEIGPVSVIERLKRAGMAPKEADGLVQDMIKAVTYPAAARQYVSAVRRASINREIERELKRLNPGLTAEDAQRVLELIGKREHFDRKVVLRATDIADNFLASLESINRIKVCTGYPTLDSNLHAQQGDLIVVGARTGVGKTTFLTNVLHTMLQDGVRCLYIPTEMKPAQFMGRLMPLMTDIPASRFRAGDLDADHKAQAQAAAARAKNFPLHVMDIASPTIEEIRRGVKETGCSVLFVDYLGRCSMKEGRNDSRPREIEKFVVALKTICVEYGLVCFLAVQLGRLVDRNTEGSPTLADLADSSAIEKEADLVLLLWKDQAKAAGGLARGIVSATIAKNRHGYLRMFDLGFDKSKMQFSEQTYTPQVM